MDILINLAVICAAALVLQCLYTRYRGGLNAIPGPFLASISDSWKILAVYRDDMPQQNIDVHRKYGPVVRIGPNHVSFSSAEALQTIYASRQAFPKSSFYNLTSPPFEGKPLVTLFSTRDVTYHSSLKKVIGGLYTKAAISPVESKIDNSLQLFTSQVQKLLRPGGPAKIDMALWVHLWSFDCLGDINISSYFGFLQSGKDVGDLMAGSDRILNQTGLCAQSPVLQVVQLLMYMLMGLGDKNTILIRTHSVVKERLRNPTSSPDMLNSFLKLQEAQPDKISTREVTGALYINLIAGNDVLAVTLRAILYYMARTPRVEEKLRAELSTLEPEYPLSKVVPYSKLLKLPILDAVVHESLRIHGNLGLLNERVTPKEGALIDGFKIPAGTVVGINPWVIHHNPKIFGDDVHEFRPERWLEKSEKSVMEMKKNLFSFGAGPRMCIGKNLAMMQIYKFTAEFYRHFAADLAHPEKDWHVTGNWVTKQSDMDMLVTEVKQKSDS